MLGFSNTWPEIIILLLLINISCQTTLQEEFPDDEKCEKMGSMLIEHIINKTPLPTNYTDAYKLLKFSGTGLFDTGDYSGCKSLPYADFHIISYRVMGFSVSLGVCYFKECNTTYINNTFTKILDKFNETLKNNFEVFTPEDKLTEIRKENKVGCIITLTVLGLLFSLCLFATISKKKALEGFSLEKSAKSIFNIVNPTKSYEHLRVFDGVRFLSAGWILFGHLCVFPMSFMKNVTGFLNLPKKWYFPILSGAYYSVDVFFFLSGFLFYFGCQKYFGKQISRIKMIGVSIFLRYVRLLPFMVIATKAITTVLPFVASGPLYYMVNSFNSGCDKHAWHNFLYINNLIKYKRENNDGMCATQTWYLGCDMQFFLLSVLIVFPFNNMPKVRHAIFCTLFVASCIAQMAVCLYYRYDYNSFMGGGGRHDDDRPKGDFFNDFYINPYARITPYIMGIYFSIFFMQTPVYRTDLKNKKKKDAAKKIQVVVEDETKKEPIEKEQNLIDETKKTETPKEEEEEEDSYLYKLNVKLQNNNMACFIIFIISLGLINYGFWISNITNKYEIHYFWHAFFNTFNKIFFIGGLGMILHLTFLGKFNFIKGFLTLPLMTRVSRSTYGIYMIHIYLTFMFLASYPNYYYNKLIDVFLLALGVYGFSWLVSFILGIIIESPVINISKKYLRD